MPAWQVEPVVARVAGLVARARREGVPVVWVQHHDEELVRDTPGWRWVPELVPVAGEPVVHKHHNSSFEDSTLDEVLADLGTTHVVLAGAATNWCIRATAYGALDRGYDLTLVSDGHTTGPTELDDGRVVIASDIVDELNACVRWLSYPGRRSTAARADLVELV